MRVLLAALAVCASCTPRTVDVLEPLATTPPQPGYPLHTVIPYWHRPAVLCVVANELPPPEFTGSTWRCPDPVQP